MLAGGFFLLIAIVSIFIPILPQLPFAIAAAYLFSKGSARLHLWVRHNKYFGKAVRDWEDFQIIRTRTKIISTVLMLGGMVMGHMKWGAPWAWMLDFIFLVTIAFVCTRRSRIFSRPLL